MPNEKSAGAVMFRRDKYKIFYLLLHYEAGHWSFPKGNIEKGEELKETVEREVKEETGITDLEFTPGFKEHIKYIYKRSGETIFKIVTYFLAETKTKKVKISYEHTGFEWLPYEDAIQKITYNNAKEILKKADKVINN